MSSGNDVSRTTGNLRLVDTDGKLNDIGINRVCDGEKNKYGKYRIFLICSRYSIEQQSTLVNKQIAYLFGISLETDQIRVGKNLFICDRCRLV